MILDTIENAASYAGLHAGIDMALKAVAAYTPENYETGRIEIDGEAVGTSPFVFELVPQCIRVVVGSNYKM